MSKVTITLELDRFICTELSDVREMIETLDFSGLKASVERIQKHANSMESALHNYNSYMNDIKKILDDTETSNVAHYEPDLGIVHTSGKKKKSKISTDKEKLNAIKDVLKKKYHEW